MSPERFFQPECRVIFLEILGNTYVQINYYENNCIVLYISRVLEAVDIPELNHLQDCVVFPTEGERPHADEQSGGDLDGDIFFITWNENLIPKGPNPKSEEYPAATARPDTEITFEKMAKYFSIQNKGMQITGKLDTLYRQWADAKGSNSSQCDRIGKLFGRAIDAQKSGENVQIPDDLCSPPTPSEEKKYVWQKMEHEAKAFKQRLLKCREEKVLTNLSKEEISLGFVMNLIHNENGSLTEYQKFALALQYLGADFYVEDFLDNFQINFAMFSCPEKTAAIDLGIPVSIVTNALTQSTILSIKHLEFFNLLHPNQWGFYYQSENGKIDLSRLSKALTSHTSSLLCIRMPNEVTIVIQIDCKMEEGTENVLKAGTVRSYFISEKFGLQRDVNFKEKDLYYDLVEDRLQIYRERKLVNTFVFIKRDSVIKNKKILKLDDSEMVDMLSIDLTTFQGNLIRANANTRHPTINKTQIVDIEVFGINKDDPAYPDVIIGNAFEDEDFEGLGKWKEMLLTIYF